ncbi:MAG: penicillin-binding protein [Burkholderiales bacterium]|nr:penicillin-binding protein [Burkholderiales bacterium]
MSNKRQKPFFFRVARQVRERLRIARPKQQHAYAGAVLHAANAPHPVHAVHSAHPASAASHAHGSSAVAGAVPPTTEHAEQVLPLPSNDNPTPPDISPAPPPSNKPPKSFLRRLWGWFKLLFWLCLLTVIAVLSWLVWHETHDSHYQAQYFHEHARQATFSLGDGASKAIRFPASSPFDERLGYANLPEFLTKLRQKDFDIVKQARISPKMAEIADMGLFIPYREKTQVGLDLADCHQQTLFSVRYPERIFPSFEAAPSLLVKSLLFVENRELLDTHYPKRNPAVEWDRLAKAVLEQAANGFSGERKTAGGSTLATQIEKYRHSPEGRTSNIKDKLRQMVSASLRAYQGSEETLSARRQILLDYLNTVPLSAKPGFGEVNGIGDGLWVWYGRDFQDSTQLLTKAESVDGNAVDPQAALVYKEALSLMIAQRRPSYYLGDPDSDLEQLTDAHLRLLAANNVITPQLRDAALQARLASALKTKPATVPNQSFVTRKAVTAMRTHLSNLLGDSRLYNVDRLDLSVVSTINAEVQQSITSVLRELRDAEKAKAAGLQGKGMLGNGDPANVVYSFTLLERGDDANYLRVQTDNFDQPLDINDGAKLDLGSTAKLRTLVSYLDIVGNLFEKYQGMDAAALKVEPVDPKDKIKQWELDYHQHTEERDLPAMLQAALERKYSASTGEGFFTGGGMHYFGNFNASDNGRIMSVREGLRHSVNLVFVRLMRDVVHHYMFQSPGSSATLLQDVDDPRRAAYLSKFADREGKEFINRFYPKYKGKTPEQAEKILLQNLHPTPNRLAALYQTIAPDASFAQFAAFVKENLPSQNELSNEKLERTFTQHAAQNMSLADRGYVARVHPLELWVVGYLRKNQNATLAQVVAASAKERQEVYSWLFSTHRKHAQDKRIAGLLEVEGFLEVHRQWKRMGYPFDSMVPSYASALGASADRPAALAEMMGIIINQGQRKPTYRITSLHFAQGTPYETLVQRAPGKAEQVLNKDVAQALAGVIREVVSS